MRGHVAIENLRMRGMKPKGVWVYVGDGVAPCSLCVDIGTRENAQTLDLRWAVGLTVHLTGEDDLQVLRVQEALLRAKAGRVITMIGERIVDSEGHLSCN